MTQEEQATNFLIRECGLNVNRDGVPNAIKQAIEYGNIANWFSNPINKQEVILKETFIQKAVFFLRHKIQLIENQNK